MAASSSAILILLWRGVGAGRSGIQSVDLRSGLWSGCELSGA